jgi:hypothetical protein
MLLSFSLFYFILVPKMEVAIAIDDKLGENVVKNLLSLRRWKRYPTP